MIKVWVTFHFSSFSILEVYQCPNRTVFREHVLAEPPEPNRFWADRNHFARAGEFYRTTVLRFCGAVMWSYGAVFCGAVLWSSVERFCGVLWSGSVELCEWFCGVMARLCGAVLWSSGRSSGRSSVLHACALPPRSPTSNRFARRRRPHTQTMIQPNPAATSFRVSDWVGHFRTRV